MNRVFTGNYNDCKIGNLISISGDRGRSVGFTGKSLPKLAPKKVFWDIWHKRIGKISEEENNKYYIREYYWQVLSKVDIEELLKNEKDPILLCFERKQEFCHRHVVAEYINIRYGTEVKDIEIDENLNVAENPRPTYIRKLLEEVLKEEYKDIKDEILKVRIKELGIIKEEEER